MKDNNVIVEEAKTWIESSSELHASKPTVEETFTPDSLLQLSSTADLSQTKRSGADQVDSSEENKAKAPKVKDEIKPKLLAPMWDGTIYQTAKTLRAACRAGVFSNQTSNQAPGAAQANLVILPKEHAEDFRKFCEYNSAACPLLEMTQPGQFEFTKLAPGSDIRSDVPKYRVWRHGKLIEERLDIADLWTEDMQAFLLGCSFTWDRVLDAAGYPPKHLTLDRNTPMFDTSVELRPSGPFRGNTVVSMRPYRPADVRAVSEITHRYKASHGGPIQVGNADEIGIRNIERPEHGDSIPVDEGEVPVFWACGVTPQNALVNAKLPLAITHAPGFMFVADRASEEMKKWKVPGEWLARPNASLDNQPQVVPDDC